MIRKLKRFMAASRRRVQILAQARTVLRQLEGQVWEHEAAKPIDEMMNMLLAIGLAHLIAVQAGQAAGKAMIDRVEAHRAAKLN